MNKITEMKQIIDNSKSILLATHIDPDGDAIGSTLTMYNWLKNENKNVDVIIKRPSKNFSYLNRFDEIKSSEEELKESYDTIIVLDCSDKYRVALEFEIIKYNKVLVIDHHITHNEFGDITILNDKACAACEIVYDIFNILNVQITKDVAQCIYTGILTDTGCFKYSNVTPHTFEIAQELLKLDLNSSDIARRANDVMSLEKFALLKKAINKIEIINNKIAYLYLSKDDLNLEESEENIHEGLVNYGRDIESVEVSIFIRQINENEYKVSMRSNDYVNVAAIAQTLGGGGHIRAAGIQYLGTLDNLKSFLLKEVEDAL